MKQEIILATASSSTYSSALSGKGCLIEETLVTLREIDRGRHHDSGI